MLDLIRKADPDVLALQEDTNEQVNYIRDGLQGSHRAFYDPAFYEADNANNAVLVRNTIEVAGSGAFWISSDGKTRIEARRLDLHAPRHLCAAAIGGAHCWRSMCISTTPGIRRSNGTKSNCSPAC